MKKLNITIKLFSGLENDAKLTNYNLAKGYKLQIKPRTRLRTVIKILNLNKKGTITFYRDGDRLSKWSKLKDGDLISCFRPTGGG